MPVALSWSSDEDMFAVMCVSDGLIDQVRVIVYVSECQTVAEAKLEMFGACWWRSLIPMACHSGAASRSAPSFCTLLFVPPLAVEFHQRVNNPLCHALSITGPPLLSNYPTIDVPPCWMVLLRQPPSDAPKQLSSFGLPKPYFLTQTLYIAPA